ncbi:TPA: D-glycerate dehydrogenase, partial [bacterium]|nr:D-glycerate dehydrogenase [bacterium]
VYVTRMLPGKALDVLRETCDVEVNPKDEAIPYGELIEKVKNRDGIITLLTDKIDANLIKIASEGNPPLRVIANYAVGYDNIDVATATKHSIFVSNTPGVLTNATADIAWALMFAIARRIPEAEKFLRAGKFKGWSPTLFLGADIFGKTLGIIGVGRIGAAVASRAKGFNMKVLYYDIRNNKEIDDMGAQRVDMDTLLKESDFISVHVPLMPETHHLIGKRNLSMMKPTAYLINTSRGPVVDEAALAEALKNKVIAGAGLDVFEEEPKVHPDLLELDNVVIVPHIASATVETRSNMAMMAVENVIAVLNGKRPPNAVNSI